MDLFLGVYGYAMQIYCDFSAYSDIAIGVAALLGYRFEKNFDRPYCAKSLQEFWRRWHISLSSWLRDYLYISLGGNRKGTLKTYRNLFLTMLLGGLWHGAAWNFVLWGMMHGTYLAIEKMLRDRFGTLARSAFSSTLAVIIVFHFVCLTWIFFAAPSFEHAIQYLSGFLQIDLAPRLVTPFIIALIFAPLASQFIHEDFWMRLSERFEKIPLQAQGIVLGTIIVLLSAIGPQGVLPFIYFQF